MRFRPAVAIALALSLSVAGALDARESTPAKTPPSVPAPAPKPAAKASPKPGIGTAPSTPARERQQKCGQEWRSLSASEKAAQGPGWPQFYSRCVKRLKAEKN